ncbi:YciI family protein [Cellulomonas fimi]|uniref:YciI family protein n=1 Tax=Cellulomonas fimi TaxID=1708 RepID=UPI00234D8990|nr:YciI family protein [Cellulomonas fimi]MDC7123210.1 YciI family protein [Cellulomonas fimi]
MARYLVMLRGDQATWDAWTDADMERNSARHQQLARLAPGRGHVIVGGEELTHSGSALVVRRSADGSGTVSDGPYAELVEQVGGYYLVDTDDVRDLAALLAETLSEGVEIRGFVDHSADVPAPDASLPA